MSARSSSAAVPSSLRQGAERGPAPAIAFERVHKRYPGGIEALRGITLSVAPGELVLITGHSGAGKSTLLRLAAAIERPTSGTVLVGGQNVGSLRPGAVPYLRRRLGLVFQDQKLLFDRTAFDNVMLPLAIARFDPREAARRVRAALDKVGLLGREKAYPIALSGGEQQRLAIARAIVHRPSILLADEPTAHVDAAHAGEIAELFRSFHQVGVTVVIATHDPALAARLGARVIVLSNGAIGS